MKFLSTLFFLCILFVSCNSNNSGSGASGNELLSLNRQIFKAIETGDSTTLQRSIHKDITDHGAGAQGKGLRGNEVLQMYINLHRQVQGLKYEIEKEAVSNDHVFSLIRVTGTTREPLWGMPANTTMNLRSVHLVRYRDETAIEHWMFAEPSEMLRLMEGTRQ